MIYIIRHGKIELNLEFLMEVSEEDSFYEYPNDYSLRLCYNSCEKKYRTCAEN